MWEQTFRDHLRRLAVQGQLADQVVAVGPWWSSTRQDEIDALVLAGRSRRPVLAGEAKWARTEDGRRVVRALQRKAAAVTKDPDALRYAVCARDQVTHAPDDTLVVTARDILTP